MAALAPVLMAVLAPVPMAALAPVPKAAPGPVLMAALALPIPPLALPILPRRPQKHHAPQLSGIRAVSIAFCSGDDLPQRGVM